MKTASLPRSARVFRNGNSVAVRLPMGWVKAGTTVQATQNGTRIILETENKRPRTVADMLDYMAKYGLQDEEFDRQQPPIQERDCFKD